MNFSAIRHIPMSQDAHGIDPAHIVLRLRAGRNDLRRCTLFYGDRACRRTPVDFFSAPMELEAWDQWFDYFQVILDSPFKRLCYYFELDDGKKTILYYGDFFSESLVDDRSEYYQLPFNHPGDITAPPGWAFPVRVRKRSGTVKRPGDDWGGPYVGFGRIWIILQGLGLTVSI